MHCWIGDECMKISDTALYAESWNVAYRFKPEGTILNEQSTEFIVIPNNFRYWAADPIVIEQDGKVVIFAELYDYIKRRGIIGYTVLRENDKFSRWKPIIKEKYHMSYPFVFQLNGETVMLPETSAAKKLMLYQATLFPDKWQPLKEVAKGVEWVDTTVVSTGEQFLGITQSLGVEREDLLLSFDSQFNIVSEKPFLKHDSSHNRNGGRIFTHKGSTVRVCQDCETEYGAALLFKFYENNLMQEIKTVRLTPTDLQFSKKLPLKGMHTYTATQNIEVIDIKTRRFNVLNFLFRILGKLR